MRYLYSAFLLCLTPFFLIRLWLKGKKSPAYRQRIAERLGLKFKQHSSIDVWVHAVSLGEVIAATTLIEGLLAKNYQILVTTMTPTGSDRVRRYFANRVIHQYLPYDLTCLMKRFIKHYRPRLALVMETELWPNLICTTHASAIPLILVNGRLSAKSFQNYRYWRFWFKNLLNQFEAILVQTADDQARFIQLGAHAKRVEVMGNVKFDLSIHNQDIGRYSALKKAWGAARPVVILASTHEDEEKQILLHLTTLQAAIPKVLILIAPRHPERFERVYQQSVSLGLNTVKASQSDLITPDVHVIVLDAMGELMQSYQCADYAFVGGSLVSIGGHNVLEPIAVGVPVFSGNLVHNFKSICETLTAMGAIRVVASAEELIKSMIALHQNPAAKEEQVRLATETLMKNRGVVDRYVERVTAVLGEKCRSTPRKNRRYPP